MGNTLPPQIYTVQVFSVSLEWYKVFIHRIIYGLPLMIIFVVKTGVFCMTQSRVKIFGKSLHKWPQTSLLTAAHIWFFFTRDFRVLKQINQWKLSLINHCSIVVVLWRHAKIYCDVILADCHENISKLVTCIFPSLSSWLSLVNYRELFTVFSLAGM